MEQSEDEKTVQSGQRTIVIAIDDSMFSEYAFDFYIKNIKKADDSVILVTVPEYHSVINHSVIFTDPTTVAMLVEEEDKRIKRLLQKYVHKMQKANVGGKMREHVGKVGETIISVADEEKADLIVVGSRGMGKLRRTVLGSVSDYCIHHSSIPVLVCKAEV